MILYGKFIIDSGHEISLIPIGKQRESVYIYSLFFIMNKNQNEYKMLNKDLLIV